MPAVPCSHWSHAGLSQCCYHVLSHSSGSRRATSPSHLASSRITHTHCPCLCLCLSLASGSEDDNSRIMSFVYSCGRSRLRNIAGINLIFLEFGLMHMPLACNFLSRRLGYNISVVHYYRTETGGVYSIHVLHTSLSLPASSPAFHKHISSLYSPI